MWPMQDLGMIYCEYHLGHGLGAHLGVRGLYVCTDDATCYVLGMLVLLVTHVTLRESVLLQHTHT